MCIVHRISFKFVSDMIDTIKIVISSQEVLNFLFLHFVFHSDQQFKIISHAFLRMFQKFIKNSTINV